MRVFAAALAAIAVASGVRAQEVSCPPVADLATLKARDGRIVPLGDVADVKRETGPAHISRDKGSRRLTVETNVSGRDTVGFVADAQAALARELELVAGYHLEWGGQFEHYTEARNRLLLVVPLAVALITGGRRTIPPPIPKSAPFEVARAPSGRGKPPSGRSASRR